MKRKFCLILCGVLWTLLPVMAQTLSGNSLSLIPYPMNVLEGSGSFVFQSKTVVVLEDAEFEGVVSDFLDLLEESAGFAPKLKLKGKKGDVYILKDESIKDEGYVLNVLPDKMEIKASGVKGVFYALQTLRQLIEDDGDVQIHRRHGDVRRNGSGQGHPQGDGGDRRQHLNDTLDSVIHKAAEIAGDTTQQDAQQRFLFHQHFEAFPEALTQRCTDFGCQVYDFFSAGGFPPVAQWFRDYFFPQHFRFAACACICESNSSWQRCSRCRLFNSISPHHVLAHSYGATRVAFLHGIKK